MNTTPHPKNRPSNTLALRSASSDSRLRWMTTLSVLVVASLAHGMAHSRNFRGPDKDGFVSDRIEHRLADEIVTTSPFGQVRETNPTPRKAAPTAGSTSASKYPISSHGGPIMSSISKLVVIWYGNWNQNNGADTPAAQQLIRDALYGLSVQNPVTNYSGITTGFSSTLGKYTQSSGASVTQASSPNLVEYTQATSSTFGGTRLTDAKVFSLVKAYASVPDPNAIYLVLTSSDIAETSGFLSNYCGWHTYGAINKVSVKYAFIGNPNKGLSSCASQSVSPNGMPAVDGMISVIAHELVETVTDPELGGWYNAQGAENSDMCAWTFGSRINKLPSGAYWNVSLPTRAGGSRNYLLQRQLSAANSKCYINATGSVQ